MDTTVKKEPAPGSAQPLLMVKNLIKHFALKKDVFGRGGGVVRAVDDIDFLVR